MGRFSREECMVINCNSSNLLLKKYGEQNCSIHGITRANCSCPPCFKLFKFPYKWNDAYIRWIKLVNRKDLAKWCLSTPKKYSRICSKHFIGGTRHFPFPVLNLGYDGKNTPKTVADLCFDPSLPAPVVPESQKEYNLSTYDIVNAVEEQNGVHTGNESDSSSETLSNVEDVGCIDFSTTADCPSTSKTFAPEEQNGAHTGTESDSSETLSNVEDVDCIDFSTTADCPSTSKTFKRTIGHKRQISVLSSASLSPVFIPEFSLHKDGVRKSISADLRKTLCCDRIQVEARRDFDSRSDNHPRGSSVHTSHKKHNLLPSLPERKRARCDISFPTRSHADYCQSVDSSVSPETSNSHRLNEKKVPYLMDIISCLKDEIKVLLDEYNKLQIKLDKYEKTNQNKKSPLCDIRSDQDAFFFTGFPNQKAFHRMFALLKPLVRKLRFSVRHTGAILKPIKRQRNRFDPKYGFRKLLQKEEYLMALMRLRLGLTERDLADRFRVHVFSVKCILVTWIKLLGKELKSWVSVPSRQCGQNVSSKAFGNSPNLKDFDYSEIFSVYSISVMCKTYIANRDKSKLQH